MCNSALHFTISWIQDDSLPPQPIQESPPPLSVSQRDILNNIPSLSVCIYYHQTTFSQFSLRVANVWAVVSQWGYANWLTGATTNQCVKSQLGYLSTLPSFGTLYCGGFVCDIIVFLLLILPHCCSKTTPTVRCMCDLTNLQLRCIHLNVILHEPC